MFARDRRFVRGSAAASTTVVVELSRGIGTVLECRPGTRIVAVGGGVALAYRDADGWALDGGAVRRAVLAEGDSHVLRSAAAVLLRARDGAGQCLVAVPRPWWERVVDWVMGVPATSVGEGSPCETPPAPL